MKGNTSKKILIGAITIIFCLTIFGFIVQSNAEDEVAVTGTWDVSADDGTSNVTATLYSDGRFVISGTGKMKDYSSTSDRPYDNNKSAIITVEIQSGVTGIESYAFSGCSSLTSVGIPDSVTSIGSIVFKGCSSLTSIEVDANNSKYSSRNGVLFDKDKTKLICYPAGKEETEYIIPEGVTSIGDYAFCECSSLINIEILEGVTSIGEGGFYGCSSLTSMVIPDNVTSIESIAFKGCSSLTSIIIPKGVTRIGSEAFYGCSSLTSIIIPEGVTRIEIVTFFGCSSLTSVIIPEGVTSIGDSAFYGCSSLTSIIIPKGVTSIGDRAFKGCSSLTSIEVDANNSNYSSKNGVLFNKDKTKLICYPAGKEETGYIIPEGVTRIGSEAFYGCSSLTSVDIPDSVTSIESYAFYGCSSLTSIAIPEGVTSIEDSTFSRCSSLTSIEIPEGVTSIGSYAFHYCSSLTSIVIPEGVTRIKREAFYGCSSLTSVIIPEGVTNIGESTFSGCSSLTSVIIPEGVTSIGDSAFSGCSSLTSIAIPEGVTSIEDSTFYRCSSLTSIEIPNYVTSIESYAFFGCRSLISIEIPISVTSIGKYAFYGVKLTVAVATGSETVQEMELLDIIKRTMDEEDILYTANDFTLTNCSLSEDKTKLAVNTEVASTKTVSLEVTEGALNGLTVVVVVPSGTITYSTTSWTDGNVTARIYVAYGETIQNNEGNNTYIFTENGNFTFKYLTAEGEEKEVTATVNNIEELTIKNYVTEEENGIKYIESIKPGATIQEVKENIETNGTVKVYKEEREITEESTQIATEMTVKITWGTTDEEIYTLVVTGDLNGDGQMGNVDLLKLVRYSAGLDTNLSGAYLKAADIYKDGKYADNKDILKMARVLTGLEEL